MYKFYIIICQYYYLLIFKLIWESKKKKERKEVKFEGSWRELRCVKNLKWPQKAKIFIDFSKLNY